MDVLVLGGTRFFGRRLVLELLGAGHRVTVASRGRAPDHFGERVERLRLDRTDAQDLRRSLSGLRFDVVYDQLCFDPRDARALLDALGGRMGRLIFTSSGAVYQGTDGVTREDAFDPLHHRVDLSATAFSYAEGKQQAEAYLFRHAACPVVAARVVFVLSGTDDYTRRFESQVDHVAENRSIGLRREDHDTGFVTAWDAARFLRFVGTESDFAGPINVSSPDFLSARELARRIGHQLGREPRFHIAADGDPDLSPYAVAETHRTSPDLARSIGFHMPEIGPQIAGMVDDVLARRRDGTQHSGD